MTLFSVNSVVLKAVGLVTGTLIGAYILWGPSPRRKNNKKGKCPGLLNLGNTCFLNALLQALAPCSSMIQWLDGFIDRQRQEQRNRYLAHTLHHILRVLNNDSIEFTDDYSPVALLVGLKARRWHISTDQQDAHELFHVLTETLAEEVQRYPNVVSMFDTEALGLTGTDEVRYQSPDQAQSRIDALLPILPPMETDHPFRGLLASQLQCKRCGYKYAVKYDTFDSLSLTIPPQHVGALSLDRLLRDYIMSEVIQNVDCEGCCPKQKSTDKEIGWASAPKSTCIKKLTIGRLPTCLCIHIQRTVFLNNGMPVKRFEHVSFPEVLHMDSYTYQKRQKSYMDILTNASGRLVGGKNLPDSHTKMFNRRLGATSPTVSVPYSGPVNLLKALNYHTRTKGTGLYMGCQRTTTDQSDSAHIQQLAQTYSAEVYSPVESDAYKLTAAVVHLGDFFSGHFVTYRRVPSVNGQHFPDRWLYTSDSLVRRARLSEVLSSDAYMLFYERI